MQRITSRQNAIVRRYRAAARGGAAAELLLDGAHLLADALAAGVELRHVMVDSDAVDRPEVAPLLERAAARGIDLASASAGVMDAASPVRSPSGIVALAGRPRPAGARVFAAPAPLVVLASGIQDAGNVGAIVRVAEAAGASGVVLAGPCADPFGWKALRGAMGSALRLPLLRHDDLSAAIAEARRSGCRIFATVPRGGTMLFDARLTGASAILLGGEGAGLPDAAVDAADERLTIPMQPPVESLNAAVAAAVVLYEARRQRTKAR